MLSPGTVADGFRIRSAAGFDQLDKPPDVKSDVQKFDSDPLALRGNNSIISSGIGMKGGSWKQPVISQADATGTDIPGISQPPQLLGMGASSAEKGRRETSQECSQNFFRNMISESMTRRWYLLFSYSRMLLTRLKNISRSKGFFKRSSFSC